MAENLNSGTQVSASSGQVADATLEKSCYNDDAANCVTYGGLYTWAEAMNLPASCNTATCASSIAATHQGICPDGWHIPKQADIVVLLQEVGVSSIAGLYLKSETGWNTSKNGTDIYGFTVLPGGFFAGSYQSVGDASLFWNATENTIVTAAKVFEMDKSNSTAVMGWVKTDFASIRCVKN